MEKAYSASKVAHDRYKIYGPKKEPIQNHRKKELPFLTRKVARNLCRDLNEIHRKNQNSVFLQARKNDPSFALLKTEGYGRELAESFSYCFLSTMMEAGEEDFSFEVKAAIQKGFLYSYLLQTPRIKDFGIIKELSYYFRQAGIILSDYFNPEKSSSTTSKIVQHFEDLLVEMEPYQRLMVQLLYQFFDNFSIALPVLWVNGHLHESQVVGAYWLALYGEDLEDMRIQEEASYEAPKFLISRMHYLMITSHAFSSKDNILPI